MAQTSISLTRWLLTIGMCAAVFFLICGSLLLLWRFRAGPLPQPTVDDLKFPVAVFFSPDNCYVDHSPEDLVTMNILTIAFQESPPLLIDNELNLFQMNDLKSTENPYKLWLLKAGTGSTQVSFTLKSIPDQKHLEVQKLLVGVLNSDLPEDEYLARKNRIFTARTLEDALRTD